MDPHPLRVQVPLEHVKLHLKLPAGRMGHAPIVVLSEEVDRHHVAAHRGELESGGLALERATIFMHWASRGATWSGVDIIVGQDQRQRLCQRWLLSHHEHGSHGCLDVVAAPETQPETLLG